MIKRLIIILCLLMWAGVVIAAATDTVGIQMHTDLGQYPVITSSFTMTLEDIGSSGDKITFYLIGWVENN